MKYRQVSRLWLVLGLCALLVSVLITFGFQAVTHGHMDPAEFAFVRIGETTADQVEKTCGKPWLAYETSIFDGEIDPFVSDDEPEHYAWQVQQSKKAGKRLITVYVLEYRNPRFTSEYAKFVFRDGKLQYALLPTTIWERSATGIKLAHGAPPTVRKIPVHAFDFRYTAELWSYPELGIAYLRTTSAVFEVKVVFSPEKRE